MKEIRIETEVIKLDQFLKFINLAQTGGHAKLLIKEGQVKVNGNVCTERGRKLKVGDIVEIADNDSYKII
ncbi:MAG: RNA-binding S4 domain-containing protein [Tissierellia bacterium]|nr:RNA-binding S4 domain-containing protein [Tissierellia bacterium]